MFLTYRFFLFNFYSSVGYTLSFFSYSMWKGKTMFLEDIYVRPNYRKYGIGRMLFVNIMQLCQQLSCKALAFHVLDWNPAKKFYEKFNAVNWTERSGQQFFRLEEHVIDKLLSEQQQKLTTNAEE